MPLVMTLNAFSSDASPETVILCFIGSVWFLIICLCVVISEFRSKNK